MAVELTVSSNDFNKFCGYTKQYQMKYSHFLHGPVCCSFSVKVCILLGQEEGGEGFNDLKLLVYFLCTFLHRRSTNGLNTRPMLGLLLMQVLRHSVCRLHPQ